MSQSYLSFVCSLRVFNNVQKGTEEAFYFYCSVIQRHAISVVAAEPPLSLTLFFLELFLVQ